MMYQYKALITEVYDGDTVTANIDLGFDIIMHNQKCRLYGINTPELNSTDPDEQELAYEARDWLRKQILNKEVLIQTVYDQTGKYGRILVTIFIDNRNINQELIDLGYAKPYYP